MSRQNSRNTLNPLIQKQLQARLNEAARLATLELPKGGWVRTLRKALGMTGNQLGKRLGVGKSRISQLEDAEVDGSITLKSLRDAAAVMGCRVVYAVVPEESIEALVEQQAGKRAAALVKTASTHMALENQSLSQQKQAERVQELKQKFIETRPKELWDE